MAAASALSYTYSYRSQSALVDEPARKRLFLALSAQNPVPAFFRGRLVAPKRAADALLTISGVVRSRFHVPSAMLEKILLLADPVITCGGERLRFEGFSSCCGAYARLDLLPSALDGEFLGSGTSNVDFNAPMRAALGRVRDGDDVALALDAGSFEVRSGDASVVERKVDLPMRWLRGFTEVQAYQARMERRLEVNGAELRHFLRELPVAWKGAAWVSPSPGGLRLSRRAAPAAALVGGVARLRLLRGVAEHAESARVFVAGESGASAWEVTTPDSRFVLALSPDVWRGFSGEGQTLEALSPDADAAALTAVRAALRWQNAIDAERIAASSGLEVRDVRSALARCAASGLVGYDLAEGAYFHRELPFDLDASRRSHLRLRNARKLLAQDGVELEREEGGDVKAWVRSGSVDYRVRLDGERARCTCPWHAKHSEERGPCKHVLAVRMKLEQRARV
jgi:predicted nucleic acid-binding Zn finger protein